MQRFCFFCLFLLLLRPFPCLADGARSGEVVLRENRYFQMGFSSVGASLDRVILRAPKFQDDILQLDRMENSGRLALQLFPATGGTLDDSAAVYEMESNKTPEGIEELHFSTVLRGEDGQALLAVRRSYRIHPDSHRVEFRLKLRNEGTAPVRLGQAEGPGFSLSMVAMLGESTLEDLGVIRRNGEYETVTLGQKDIREQRDGIIDYAGVTDTFFVSLLEFSSQKPRNLRLESFEDARLDARKSGYPARIVAEFPALELEGREARSFDFTLFHSRKSYRLLEGYGLAELCDMSFLSVFIMNILFYFYNITSDWGMSIILLTIAIRILLHPLTVKQTRSMKAMQKIQPLVNDLKIRYKDNAQKMNEEVMRLYREHQINPLGGCLPLLIQIPILIALFTSLRNSIELRGEHFLWMPDLSGADPLYVLPILITVTMHWQQKQMNVDPNQAAAMRFMPLFMLFICLSLPAGVLLYWLVSNVLQILQQAYDTGTPAATLVPVPGENGDGEANRKKRKRH